MRSSLTQPSIHTSSALYFASLNFQLLRFFHIPWFTWFSLSFPRLVATSLTSIVTVKASNLAPHGNLARFLARSVVPLGDFVHKNKK
jgi:hypothetical protein